MTIKQIAESMNAEIISMPLPDRIPDGAYCGDLLSWVMGHAKPDNIWVTIMTNKNVLAVASLLDLSCIIICEDAQLDEEFINTAQAKEINIIRCGFDSYEACTKLYKLLEDE